MLDTLRNTLAKCNPPRPLRKALLAVSGGADSIALLHGLREIWRDTDIRIGVAHINHGLRGSESDGDALFVETLAKELDLPFFIAVVDVPAAMRESADSLEMAARDLRLRELQRIARDFEAGAICTGHTADDQIETLLMRLARGTGPRGMGGIGYHSRQPGAVPVIRPLLECRGDALKDWLRSRELPWREDASNVDTSIPRNHVRKVLIPAFERVLGDRAIANTLRGMELLRDEQDNWLEPLVDQTLASALAEGGSALNLTALRTIPPPLLRRVMLSWLQRNNLHPALQTRDLMERLTSMAIDEPAGSRSIAIDGETRVLREYDRLLFTQGPEDDKPPSGTVLLRIPGETAAPEWGLTVEITPDKGFSPTPPDSARELPLSATLSAAAIDARGDLELRAIRPGDRIAPMGMLGTRKISRILIDSKVPRSQRGLLPLLTCAGRPVWLPGLVVAREFAVPHPEADSYRVTLKRGEPRAQRGARRGFSLVEALISLALAGLVIVPALVSMHGLLNSEKRLADIVRGELAALRVLEEEAHKAENSREPPPATRVFFDHNDQARFVVENRPATDLEPATIQVSARSEVSAETQSFGRALFMLGERSPGTVDAKSPATFAK